LKAYDILKKAAQRDLILDRVLRRGTNEQKRSHRLLPVGLSIKYETRVQTMKSKCKRSLRCTYKKQKKQPSTQEWPTGICPFTSSEDNPKRLAILRAASQLFIDHGYEAVSMDTIAKEAEVSKRTVYSHFENKENLFAALVRHVCHYFEKQIALSSGIEGPPEEVLLRLGRHFMAMQQTPQSIAIFRMIVSAFGRFPEIAHIFYENGPRKVHQLTADYLQKATDRGELDIEDCVMAAKQFIGMVKSPYYFEKLFMHDPQPSDDAIDKGVQQAVALFLHGCKGDKN